MLARGTLPGLDQYSQRWLATNQRMAEYSQMAYAKEMENQLIARATLQNYEQNRFQGAAGAPGQMGPGMGGATSPFGTAAGGYGAFQAYQGGDPVGGTIGTVGTVGSAAQNLARAPAPITGAQSGLSATLSTVGSTLGKVAGPAGAVYNAYQAGQSGAEFSKAYKGLKDIRDRAVRQRAEQRIHKETLQSAQEHGATGASAGALAGAQALGPPGAIVGGIAGGVSGAQPEYQVYSEQVGHERALRDATRAEGSTQVIEALTGMPRIARNIPGLKKTWNNAEEFIQGLF